MSRFRFESDFHVHDWRSTMNDKRRILWASIPSVRKLIPTTMVGWLVVLEHSCHSRIGFGSKFPSLSLWLCATFPAVPFGEGQENLLSSLTDVALELVFFCCRSSTFHESAVPCLPFVGKGHHPRVYCGRKILSEAFRATSTPLANDDCHPNIPSSPMSRISSFPDSLGAPRECVRETPNLRSTWTTTTRCVVFQLNTDDLKARNITWSSSVQFIASTRRVFTPSLRQSLPPNRLQYVLGGGGCGTLIYLRQRTTKWLLVGCIELEDMTGQSCVNLRSDALGTPWESRH